MRKFLIAAIFSAAAALPVSAETTVTAPNDSWRVIPTEKSYDDLLADLREAVTGNKMGLVTEAGPTEVAASRGETIPGNRVVGVFRNDFAVTIIRAAPAAMIEPPVRFMVMQEPDGTATLAYRLPSAVFEPYKEEGGEALATSVVALDEIFAKIADDATN